MPEKENNNGTERGLGVRIWSKRWVKILLGVAVILLILLIAGKYYIIPEIIRTQAQARLEEEWGGKVTVEGVSFDYSGRVQIHQVRLCDSQGGDCVLARDLVVYWDYLPEIIPTLTHVRLAELNMTGNLRDGKLDLPLPEKQEQPEPAEPEQPEGRFWPEGLKEVSIERVNMAFQDESGQQIAYAPISLKLLCPEDVVQVELQQHDLADEEAMQLSGTIQAATGQADLQLQLHRQITSEMTRPILVALGAENLHSLEMLISTRDDDRRQLRITGDLQKPETLGGTGVVEIRDGAVGPGDNLWVHSFATKLDMDIAETNTFNIQRIQGRTANGPIDGHLLLEIDSAGQIQQLNGVLEVTKIDLGPLLPVTAEGVRQKGTLTAIASLDNRAVAWDRIRSKIAFRVDNAQLWEFPIAAAIFGHLGVGRFDPVSVTDVYGECSTRGLLIITDRIRAASELYAIETRPGGQIDLKSGALNDLAVTAVPLQGFGRILDQIPVVDVLTNIPAQLGKELTYMKIQGNIYGDVKVRPQSVSTLGKDTIDFFREAVQAQGDLVD
ncbi:MAG: hypothetical protein ACLFUJ_12795 [Phycisphaerae bacterium]